jgi:hypothetical protein
MVSLNYNYFLKACLHIMTRWSLGIWGDTDIQSIAGRPSRVGSNMRQVRLSPVGLTG